VKRPAYDFRFAGRELNCRHVWRVQNRTQPVDRRERAVARRTGIGNMGTFMLPRATAVPDLDRPRVSSAARIQRRARPALLFARRGCAVSAIIAP
jgi:hypothetical protein